MNSGREIGPQRRWRWAATAASLFLLAFALDYLLYPLLSRRRGQNFNRGENGLWLRYRWYFGERSGQDIRRLASRLSEKQIRYAYFHVRHVTRDGTLRYHRLAAARRLVAALHREAPGVRAIAWVFAGNARLASTGIGEVDLSKPAVRWTMVSEAQWLVTACGFDGVQWDYEICTSGDPAFLHGAEGGARGPGRPTRQPVCIRGRGRVRGLHHAAGGVGDLSRAVAGSRILSSRQSRLTVAGGASMLLLRIEENDAPWQSS